MRKITIEIDAATANKIEKFLSDVGLEGPSFTWLCEHLLRCAVAQIESLQRMQDYYSVSIKANENPMRKPE